MTKKDFIVVAAALGRGLKGSEITEADAKYLVDCFAQAFKQDNARFDSEKFSAAVTKASL